MPSALAFCRVALAVRLSLRATTLVFVFSRSMVFSIRRSSFVQGRGFFVFFAVGRFISDILPFLQNQLSQKSRIGLISLRGGVASVPAAGRGTRRAPHLRESAALSLMSDTRLPRLNHQDFAGSLAAAS